MKAELLSEVVNVGVYFILVSLLSFFFSMNTQNMFLMSSINVHYIFIFRSGLCSLHTLLLRHPYTFIND